MQKNDRVVDELLAMGLKLEALAFCLLLLLLTGIPANGRLTYQQKIPNGDKVPHPCKKNTIWNGVGHLNQIGGGKRNPFGVAFSDAGFKWTRSLCQADSDKDGKTNGEELGEYLHLDLHLDIRRTSKVDILLLEGGGAALINHCNNSHILQNKCILLMMGKFFRGACASY